MQPVRATQRKARCVIGIQEAPYLCCLACRAAVRQLLGLAVGQHAARDTTVRGVQRQEVASFYKRPAQGGRRAEIHVCNA